MATETSTSPANRSSLANWWKTFKKRNPVVDDVHNENDMYGVTKKPEEPADNKQQQLQQPQGTSVGPRPILRYKSRSSNYIRPLSSATNFSPSSSESFRAHRDSFLQSQKAKNNNDSQVFGVPLEQAISLASVNISISEDLANEGIQYGAIPVVVGKCCVFLKKNGTEVEGVFRVGGASRRVKELQFLFSTPPDYGRRLDWDGYTVHDAASLLRRFLNSLPEPLIPLELYEQFREPLRSRPIVCKFLSKKGTVKKSSVSAAPAALTETPAVVENKEVEQQQGEQTQETAVVTESATEIDETINESTDLLIDNTAVEGKEKEQEEEQASPVLEQPKPVVAKPEESIVSEGKVHGLTDEEKLKKQKKVKKYKKLISEIHSTLKEYSILLNELPPASQHLLFYILDLLTVFATHSSKNLMSNKNLAAIFQPSILSHPDHDMSPEEYALSLQVVEFLLEYYRRLLEATQKIQTERSQNEQQQQQQQQQQHKQKTQVPSLHITTDNDSIKKGNDSDISVNTPVTPSSTQLHPPVSKRANRKHSKSLSSVNLPPDGLKYSGENGNKIGEDKVLLQQYNSNTDDSDAELDKAQTPTAQMFAIDKDDQLLSPPQKPFSPLNHKKSGESLTMSTNSGGNSSSLFHNIKRPLSAVFSNKEKNLSIEDILQQDEIPKVSFERETRWDQNISELPKKDNWFNRLRSRSRSSEPRSAAQ